jgi:hypothetical protein
MHKVSYAIFALPMLLLASMAQAQTTGTITFTANKTSATGSLTPVLTWSTTPVASSCTASGAWSGTKFASGTETLPAITANKSYTLTCTWGNGTVIVNWAKPAKNTDGTTLTDLAGYKVVYGTSSTSLTQSKSVTDPNATAATIAALQTGTWYFAVRAVNSKQVESGNSNVAQKTITGASAAKTVAITITPGTTPTPTPPPVSGLKTIAKTVYDVVTVNGQPAVGRDVGRIPLGKACDSTYKIGVNHYRITRTDVTLSGTPRSTTLVARCAK